MSSAFLKISKEPQVLNKNKLHGIQARSGNYRAIKFFLVIKEIWKANGNKLSAFGIRITLYEFD